MLKTIFIYALFLIVCMSILTIVTKGAYENHKQMYGYNETI